MLNITIKSTFHHMIYLLCVLFLAACAGSSQVHLGQVQTEWDFDHSIQFKQTRLAYKHFKLEVIPNDETDFERLAAFLLRKSYNLCGGYHYKMEMIQGIESFDDKRAMPNYIFPSLIAKIKC